MRYFVLFIVLCFSLSSSAQVLNVESLRRVTDTSGFSGTASLRFSLKRNTQTLDLLIEEVKLIVLRFK